MAAGEPPVERLVVVAGPSCCGKSRLIHRLLTGRSPSLARALELGPPGDWTCLLAKHVPDPPWAFAPRILLHYDLLRRWTEREPRADYDGDPCLALLGASREVAVVTLWAPVSMLAPRLRERQAKFHRHLLRGRLWNSEPLQPSADVVQRPPPPSLWQTVIAVYRELRRLGAKRRLYRAEEPLRAVYERWLRYCLRAAPRVHWIIDMSADLELLLPAAGWSVPWRS